MARINLSYRTYRFIDKDPVIDHVRTMIENTGLKIEQAHQLSGVAHSTLHNWLFGETRQPKNATINAVTSALGYVRSDRLAKDGQLVVAYKRFRDVNYKREYEAAADWLLKQAKQKAKRNGKG